LFAVCRNEAHDELLLRRVPKKSERQNNSLSCEKRHYRAHAKIGFPVVYT
jgi:hypothetical protein